METTHPPRPIERAVRACLSDLPAGSLVLAGASAGADSTALLHALRCLAPPLGLSLAAVHVDHGLRPGAAADRRFVEELCARLGVPCHVRRADVARLARERRQGLEEAGRHARRTAFRDLARELGARAVLLAHTLDDQAETVLLKLARGSGRAGLSAMRPGGDPLLRRPFLGIRRAALAAWLAALGEPHREDPSNLDRRFARNRVRHEVLPLLEGLNPRVVEALGRSAASLALEDAYLDRLAAPHDLRGLGSLPEALGRRVALRELRRALGHHTDLGHEHVDALLALARGRAGALATDLPGGLRAFRDGGGVRLLPREAPPSAFLEPLPLDGTPVALESGLRLRARPAGDGEPLPARGLVVRVASRALGPRPVLRSPRPGDRFRPLGAPGGRPLSRYLADRKVPRALRAASPLVVGEGGIVWVVGHQIAELARTAPGDPAWVLEAELPATGPVSPLVS